MVERDFQESIKSTKMLDERQNTRKQTGSFTKSKTKGLPEMLLTWIIRSDKNKLREWAILYIHTEGGNTTRHHTGAKLDRNRGNTITVKNKRQTENENKLST